MTQRLMLLGQLLIMARKRDQETKSRQEQDYRIRQETRNVSSKYEAWHILQLRPREKMFKLIVLLENNGS